MRKKHTRIGSLALVLVLLISMMTPAFADESLLPEEILPDGSIAAEETTPSPEADSSLVEGPEEEAPSAEEVENATPSAEEPEEGASSAEEPEEEAPSTDEPEEAPSAEDPESEIPSADMPENEVSSTEEPENEAPSTEELEAEERVNGPAGEPEEELVWVEIDGSDQVLQTGGFPSAAPEQIATYAAYDEQAVKDRLRAGWLDRLEKIDVSDFGFTWEEFPSLYWRLLNASPDMFYVNSRLRGSTSGGQLVSISPQYNSAYTPEDVDAFNAAVDEALECINDQMTPLEKALALHDYLAAHAAYDTTLNNHNAYQAFVERSCVCQGYALAYEMLMQKCGIPCEYVSSKEMNHGWNVIQLDGSWYHVDVTWDDPVPDTVGYARHSHFLRSDAGITEQKHHDWACSVTCTDTRYDTGWFWATSTAPVIYEGRTAYYIRPRNESQNGQLLQRAADGTETPLRSFGAWPAQDSGYIWTRTYSGLARNGNTLLFNDNRNVYQLTIGSTQENTVYTLPEAEGDLYGCHYENGNLELAFGPRDRSNIQRKDMQLKSESTKPAPATYTVTYHNADGTTVPVTVEQGKTTAAKAVPEGYLGWSTRRNVDTPEYTPWSVIQPEGNLDLYLVKKTIYTITYHNADGTTEKVTVEKGQTTQAKSVPADCLGWSTKQNAETPEYTAGAEIRPTGNLDLYLVKKTMYTVTYHNADGTTEKVTVEKGQTIQVKAVPADCLGWSTKQNAATAEYTAGAEIRPTGNLDLYLVKKTMYTVTYHNADGTTEKVTVEKGQTIRARSVPEGYLGWSTKQNAETAEYTAGAEIRPTGNLDLYLVKEAPKPTTALWKNTANGTQYIGADGKPLTGSNWIEALGHRYVFDEKGILQTGNATGDLLWEGNQYYINPDRDPNDPTTCYCVTNYTRNRPGVGVTYYNQDGITYRGWVDGGSGKLLYQTVLRGTDGKELKDSAGFSTYIYVWGGQQIPEGRDPLDEKKTIPAGNYLFGEDGVLVTGRTGWYTISGSSAIAGEYYLTAADGQCALNTTRWDDAKGHRYLFGADGRKVSADKDGRDVALTINGQYQTVYLAPNTDYVACSYYRPRQDSKGGDLGLTYYNPDGITYRGWVDGGNGKRLYQTVMKIEGKDLYFIVWRAQYLPAGKDPVTKDPIPAGWYLFGDDGVLITKDGVYTVPDTKGVNHQYQVKGGKIVAIDGKAPTPPKGA